MKAQTIVTTIEIQATPEKIWNIFTDFPTFPRWNPFLKKILGQPIKDGSIIVFDYYFTGVYLPTKALIYELTHTQSISWKGAFPLFFKYMFAGDHLFTLEEITPGRTKFSHTAILTGIMPNLFSSHIQGAVRNSHIQMNQKLKELSEGL
ncbi:SRPBCC domain-containing protein [Leptospira sarikeiensis]|uniref:SRPBCC domain-containing protein n=1 Tax=Leptospira sarikeiensis TaxID=2484943 RepID=A0A4V3JS86_9LEPT|nr:SRPBCC domain-containing protein [Leptospira sarikeiensis]TGL63650.1 SRPBCC domain-containing protein [Leptospira sarikeiensis]